MKIFYTTVFANFRSCRAGLIFDLFALQKKTHQAQQFEARLAAADGEAKRMQLELDDITAQHATAQTQLVVLKDLRKDRDRMRMASQGMWLLWQSNIPKLRASVMAARGVVMHDIGEMRALMEQELEKLRHAFTDILIKVKHEAEMAATQKVSRHLLHTMSNVELHRLQRCWQRRN